MINYQKWLFGQKDIQRADSWVYLGIELNTDKTFTTAKKNSKNFEQV